MGMEIIGGEINNKEKNLKTIQIIRDGLTAFNLSVCPHLKESVSEFSFFLSHKLGVLGGVSGRTFLGSLQIKLLWIDKNLRSQGYGQELMKKAEEFGKQKGCRFSILNTFSFQSLEFYQRMGYFIETEQKGYDHDSIRYFLRKDLVVDV